MTLPVEFDWGVSTAAFQIEGAWDEDGKGPSVWDAIAHGRPGLAGGATGDVTCDHYHRWQSDLDLLVDLGVNSYRFSVSWPRLQPIGRGGWNEPGFAFYDRLLDELLDRGIDPVLTVYHWDHPLAVEERGGWLVRDTAHALGDLAGELGRRFGDRVRRWITLNEPLSVMTGYALGFSRPAGPAGLAGGLAAAHHQLLAHGEAVAQLRAAGVSGDVGISINIAGVTPEDDTAAARAAAERAEALEDRLFLDPLLLGRYPVVDGRPLVDATDEELALIGSPVDFLGINWYCPAVVGPLAEGTATPMPERVGTLEDLLAAAPSVFGYRRALPSGASTNVMGWPVVPAALGDALDWLRTTYRELPSVYITENGYPRHDVVDDAAGDVADNERIRYLDACLTAVAHAADRGLDVRGYSAWSLLDNLEWGLGFGPRFGLVHVDFDTQQRTPKASYDWYRDLIGAHRPAVLTGA